VTKTSRTEAVSTGRLTLSKVPEITVWFWIIKILCTTVGESFADWINMTLGVGLIPTALIFTVVLAGGLGWQLSLSRYVPFVYWLTVVAVSVTGTLYTDVLTDSLGVRLSVSTSAFAVALAVIFGVWWARERTLSIHSIITLPREVFYWLAVLVTFALGTAAGDWTLELTGWGPGTSVLLPAALIVAIVIGWRLGASSVLSFWLAYILTRPLGANLGDWLGSPKDQQGLGWGVALTSVVFLSAIFAIVIYLTRTRADVIEAPEVVPTPKVSSHPARERIMLGFYVLIAVGTGALLARAADQPHATRASDDESASSIDATLAPGQSATAHFPAADVAKFRTITQDSLTEVQADDQVAATRRIKDLETAWDDAQPTLQPLDDASWTVLDGQIDSVLKALRAGNPDRRAETHSLTTLLASLG
jgi:uncharacterized membrane-anchored protein